MAEQTAGLMPGADVELGPAERRLLAGMPLHAITSVHGEAGLRERLLMEIAQFPAAGRGRAQDALALASRLHAADRRQREPYGNHLLRVAIRILSHYQVTDPDVACAALQLSCGWGEQRRPRYPPVHGSSRASRRGYRSICLLLARLRGCPGPWRTRDYCSAGAWPRSTASYMRPAWSSCMRPGTGYQCRPWPAGYSAWGSRPPSRRIWPRAGRMAPSERWSQPGQRSAS